MYNSSYNSLRPCVNLWGYTAGTYVVYCSSNMAAVIVEWCHYHPTCIVHILWVFLKFVIYLQPWMHESNFLSLNRGDLCCIKSPRNALHYVEWVVKPYLLTLYCAVMYVCCCCCNRQILRPYTLHRLLMAVLLSIFNPADKETALSSKQIVLQLVALVWCCFSVV